MSNNFQPPPKGFATVTIHEAHDPRTAEYGEVVVPIVTSTTFQLTPPANIRKYIYGRMNNPTRNTLEKMVAKLNNAKYGFCFSSGMSAIAAVFNLLKQGDHVVCIEEVFGGTNQYLVKIAAKFGVQTTFCKNNVDSFAKAITKDTKMIWVESLTNPTLSMCDIESLSKVTKRHNILLAVDNTFLTPYLMRPLDLGADIVMYSLSKCMNGHSDVIQGALVVNDEKLKAELQFLQTFVGAIPSPFDCYQVLRGLKTLSLRMKQHCNSASIIAEFLSKHPKIEKVLYPGLPNYAHKNLVKYLTGGTGGMITIYLKGDIQNTTKFLKALRVFAVAISLGGFESLICVPALTTHAGVSQEEKERLGITNTLIRLSIGLEDTEDLIEDLERGLDNC